MTTTDAAAARRHGMAVALAVAIGLSLAGCGGSSFSLFGAAGNDTVEEPKLASGPEVPIAKVAINAVVGPPDALGRQLHQEFASALGRQRVGVASAKDGSAEFNLRPYILVTKQKHGTKVSYVLDVTEASGKRVNRFAGEEIVAASTSQDTWAAITPAVAEAIASKATGAFVAWLPSAKSSGPLVSDAPGRASKTAAERPKKGAVVASSASTHTTGSITKGGLTAVIPAVTGAPGDGSTSLTAAIQRELQGKGINLAERPTKASYRVEGAVLLGAARDGKQPIQIEWVVRAPNGKKLGTVSQKNDIPEGSLDGAWGGVAEQAAGAAVKGIMKLLPNGGKAIN